MAVGLNWGGDRGDRIEGNIIKRGGLFTGGYLLGLFTRAIY